MRERAVFTGSFDPFTEAHLDVCKTASKFFDITILICCNPKKGNGMFHWLDREEMIKSILRELDGNATVDICMGSVAAYCKDKDIKYAIRGIRYSNAAEEIELAGIYNEDGVKTILLPVYDPKHINISSTRVREYIRCGLNWTRLVPEQIIPIMHKHLNLE
jgi:pantetheine-phosphate adenylyltransferase